MTTLFEILVFDDERDVGDMMGEGLAMYFPQAMVRATYGSKATVKLCRGRRPVAAIFDFEMADMGGKSSARARVLRGPTRRWF